MITAGGSESIACSEQLNQVPSSRRRRPPSSPRRPWQRPHLPRSRLRQRGPSVACDECLSNSVMTAKNRQIDLPLIPSLPPIQMPDASQFNPSSQPANHPDLTAMRRHISSPQAASPDTFMTAQTSHDSAATPPMVDEDFYGAPSPTFPQPPSLRKSISVDSFVKARQQGMQPPPTRATRGNTMSTSLAPPTDTRQRAHTQSVPAPAESLASSSRMPLREREKTTVPYPTPSRSRGTSVSTNADDREGPKFFDESDLERSEDLSRRARKSKTMSRQLMPPPGELGLPSRLQSVNSSPSISTTHPPAPIMPVRSSSLSHPMVKQRQAMSVDTRIPSVRVFRAAGALLTSWSFSIRSTFRSPLWSWVLQIAESQL